MTPLVIIGCGGFGREVWGIAQAINAEQPQFDLLGMLDDEPSPQNLEALQHLGARHVGRLEWLNSAPAEIQAVIGIGSPQVRRTLDARFPTRRWATLIHPATTLGPDVTLGEGCIVAPGARLSTNIRLGRHVHVDQGATVGHDSTLSDYARLNPQACISGNVGVGAGALVGASATVLQGLTVDANSVVGAGAVVTRDVPAEAVVKGVPAR